MREINGIRFPDTPAEAHEWQSVLSYTALASRVLAVAQTRVEGSWAAYIDAVPGYSHRMEYEEVLRVGNKLPAAIARVLFPRFTEIPYAG